MAAEPEELAAIRDSIDSVLADGCDSLALHAFYNEERDLGGELHRQAIELGWLMLALPEAAGGLGLGAAGARILHHGLGRVAAPGDLLADTVALDVLAASGDAQALIERTLGGEVRLAVAARPAEGNGTLFLGDPAAAFALAVHGEHDVALIDLAGAKVAQAPFWDMTRRLFDLADSAGLSRTVLPGLRPVLENSFALGLAADSVGLAQGIAERTLAYMREREQFGRPIASFQALKHRMADIFKAIAVAEHHVAQAADSIDGPSAPLAMIWSAQAKASTSEMAVFVGTECVQLHGGVGHTWEYDPHIYLKRARLNEALLQDNGPLRDRAFATLAQAAADGVDVLELI